MKFSYQARTKEGEIQTGETEASSREAALSLLQRSGLFVTYLIESQEPFWQKSVGFLAKTRKGDIVFFTRQLAIMIKSNIPVVESLETIARQTKKKDFQEKIMKLAEQIEGGTPLSQALTTFPEIFSPFFIGMVKSGEVSGNIPESLDYLADYLEREDDFRSKLIAALTYPAFVIVVFIAIMFVMAIMVVPEFGEIFAETGVELPWLTKLVIKLSTFLKEQWWLPLLFIFGLGIGLVSVFKNKIAKKRLDRFLLDLPLIGDFFKKVYLSQIALNLSTLIAGGVPISQALEIVADVVDNHVYQQAIFQTREGVRAGQTMSSVFSAHPEEFSLLFIQMVIVGEKTGNLENSLQNIVSFYQKQVERTLESFVKLLEPMLIIVLGILVVGLAMSLFVPLFQRVLMT